MASYVSPNYNPAYFELPIFEAPIDMAFKVAQQKQSQFDAGLQQVKSQYQNYLNIGIQSQYNTARKEAFMKDAEQKLRQISTADFSLQENVSAANNIYKPLTQDKSILREMSQLNRGNKGIQEFQRRSNSKEENFRKTANQYSEFLINFEMNKIAGAKTQEELDAVDESNLNYVAATDWQERFQKQLSTITNSKGGVEKEDIYKKYFIKQSRNGKQAINPFTTLGISMLTPEDIAYFQSVGKADLIRTEQGFIQNGFTKEQARRQVVSEIMQGEHEKYQNQINTYEDMVKGWQGELDNIKKLPKDADEEKQAQADDIIKSYEENIKNFTEKTKNLKGEQLAFDPVNGKDTYKNKFSFYMARPEVGIGNNIAYRNASNLATSFAMATEGSSLGENKFETEMMKYKTEVLKAQFKTSNDKDEKDKDKDTHLIVTSGQVSTNKIDVAKIPEIVKEREKQLVTGSYLAAAQMVEEVFKLSPVEGISYDAFTTIHNAVTEGHGDQVVSDDIIEQYKKISPAFTKGMTNAQFSDAVVKWAGEQIKSATSANISEEKIGYLANAQAMQENYLFMNKGLEFIHTKRKEVESRILMDEKIRSPKVDGKYYGPIAVKEGNEFRLLTQDEWIDDGKKIFNISQKTEGEGIVKTIGEFVKGMIPNTMLGSTQKEMTFSEAAKYAKENGIPMEDMTYIGAAYNKSPNATFLPYEGITGQVTGNFHKVENFKTMYDKRVDIYNKATQDVNNKIATELAPLVDGIGMKIAPNQKQVATQYKEFSIDFDNSTTATNEGETLASNILDPRFTDQQFGALGLGKDDLDPFTSMVGKLRTSAGPSLKAGDGRIRVNPVGKDGRSPEYTLTFSQGFLKANLTEDELKSSVGQAIMNKGIIVNNPEASQRLNAELSGRFSIYAQDIKNSKLSEGKYGQIGENYTYVKKMGDNYLITPFFKVNGILKQGPIQTVPRETLDNAIRFSNNLVRQQFFQAKQQTSAKTQWDAVNNN